MKGETLAASVTVFDEQVAARYEAWYETPEGRRADRLEKAVLHWLLRGLDVERILEIGSGTGHFSRWFQSRGLSVVGLDLSSAMLVEARALGGGLLVQGDAHRLPFADATFDLSLLITTLEFLREPQAALAEAVRVARRGVVLGVLNRWSLLAWQRRLAGLRRRTVYDKARFYGVGELKRMARAAAGGRLLRLMWRTTLFSTWGPWSQAMLALPWGGFIGLVLLTTPPRDPQPDPKISDWKRRLLSPIHYLDMFKFTVDQVTALFRSRSWVGGCSILFAPESSRRR